MMKNQGTAATGPLRFGVYLSRDQVITNTVTFVNFASNDFNFPAGGTAGFGDKIVIIPMGTPPGSYYIRILADDNNRGWRVEREQQLWHGADHDPVTAGDAISTQNGGRPMNSIQVRKLAFSVLTALFAAALALPAGAQVPAPAATPVIGTATAGDARIVVHFRADPNSGGFTAVCKPQNGNLSLTRTGRGPMSPVTVDWRHQRPRLHL